MPPHGTPLCDHEIIHHGLDFTHLKRPVYTGCHGHLLPGCTLNCSLFTIRAAVWSLEGALKRGGRGKAGSKLDPHSALIQDMSLLRVCGEGSRTPSSDGWGSELGWSSLANSHSSHRQPVRAPSPLPLTQLDLWDRKPHLRVQSSLWSSKEAVSGAGIFSTHKSSPPSSDSDGSLRTSPRIRRWQSLSRLGPEGAPRSLSSSSGVELRAALMESGVKRAELVHRLREAQERLDTQTDLLKVRDTQLQHSQTSTQLLELRQKQLADAVSTLEQEKEAAELCRFEETRRRSELQDKVLQLELDMLKMRSTLQKRISAQHTPPGSLASPGSTSCSAPLSKSLPATQEDLSKQKGRQMERELREAREALRDVQEQLQSLEEERERVLRELRSAKENKRSALSQVEEARERLSSSLQAQSELQDELNEARNHLDQAGLERDLLSSKVLRIEDSLEDVKLKLSGAMADKDRIMQEKVELHQRVQSLELELERAQRGREGFTEQVCELHEELADAKARANRQEQERVQMKEEAFTLNESHKAVSAELMEARQRLEAVLGQLHELEAERVIHTNQITALETERSQLIGEKEDLVGAVQQSSQEEVTELRQSCSELRDSQNALQLENQELQRRCQAMETGILEKEVELQRKEAQLLKMEEANARAIADTAEKVEELRRVGSHWKERWQDVAVTLRTTQDELEETKQQQFTEMTHQRQEAERLGQELEKLQREAESSHEQLQAVLRQRAEVEEELDRVKKEGGALVRVELDACRQQLDLEKSRSQNLLRQLSSSPVREGRRGSLPQESSSENEVSDGTTGQVKNPAILTHDRGTETDLFIPAVEHFQSCQKSSSQQDIIQALSTTSLQEVDGELGQMRAELQQVWDMLKERDTELEEHQQELLSARGQVSQHSSEVQRLEQRLTDREQELENKEQALRSLARLRDAERTETQLTISSLEMKLAELMEMGIKQTETKGGPECPGNSDQDALLAELEDMRKRNAQLQEDKDKVVRTLQLLQQRKAETVIPETKKEIRPENLDHDKQRRLVTEQLKTLFKEREQHGPACSKLPVALRGSASLKDRSAKSKNAVYTPANQRKGNDEVQQGRDSPPGVTEKVVPAGQQGAPDMSELPGMREQVARLKEELESKTNKMSAMSVEICNLRERNDSLLTAQMRFKQELQEAREAHEQGGARLFESSMEKKREPGPFFNVADGTYRARQVNVGGSEEEEEEEGDEEGEKMRVALGGEAEGTSLQDSWDSLPSSVGTGVISMPLSRTQSVDHLNLLAPSAAQTPDQSPLFPRSWAGSQECLFSPRPYRSQADRAFRPVEVYNRAFIFPCVEPEERRHLHEA